MSASAPNVRSIFDSVIEIDSPAQRQAYLDAACAGQPEIRQKVDALLRSHDDPGSFLQVPPSAVIHQCHEATELYSPITEGPGSRIGPYKLLQQIGEGGFGVVYMAEQQAPVRRKVALKIIKPGMDTREVIARFESER